MKYLLASAVLCFCTHSVVLAQGQEMPRRSCRECDITKTYQPTSNSTVVLLKLMPVADVTDGKMYISLTTSYGANEASKKSAVSVSITFIAKELIEIEDPVLRAQTDESAINLGRLARSTDSEGTLKISSYAGFAPRDDVQMLGQSKKVEMSFGGIKFSLTEEHQAAIVDFLAYAAGDP